MHPSKSPFDAAIVPLKAGDVLADAFFEDRLPGGTSWRPNPVLDHGEAPADEAGDALTHMFAGFAYRVS